MNKKLKKLKNRLVSTIQGNYSIEDLQERNKSSSANYKLKTLISQKIQSTNPSKLNSKTKRVYLTNMNNLTQNQNVTLQNSQKEEYLRSMNSQLKQRYITRVKSSNGGKISDSSLTNQRSIRHTNKLNKIIKNINEVQFESELYWNGSSSYLVTGVKNQYQKIKKSYQEKCIELEKIKRQYQVDQTKELKIYIEKLEKQNTRLVEACEKFRNKLHKQREANSHLPDLVLEKFKANNQNQIIQDELNEIYERYEKLQKKVGNLQNKNSILSKQNKNLLTKVFLQQKIVIENQNRQFKQNSFCKKLQKEVAQVKESLRKNQEKSKSLQQNSDKHIIDVKSAMREEYLFQKKALLERIRQKDGKIDRMDKQILHMKNLLESWQHSEQNEQNQMKQEQERAQKSRESEMRNEKNSKSNRDFLKLTTDKIKLKFKDSKDNGAVQNNNSHVQNPNNSLSQRSLNKSSLRSRGQIIKGTQKATQKNIKRQRVTALTHKQNSVRCRPVESNEIQRIIQYLKLKLGFKRFNPAELTQYFEYRNQYVSLAVIEKNETNSPKIKQTPTQTKRQMQQQSLSWEQEYITLKEVYDAFLKAPFEIKDAQAILLSRFIIEDAKEPYVYMNWDSQNSRRMAKSIIANLLNFDTLNEKTIEKSEELLKKYEPVLTPALKAVSSKTGQISKQKFIQILNGLGLERTKYMDEYIIGKLCCYSTGLHNLEFASLYASNK